MMTPDAQNRSGDPNFFLSRRCVAERCRLRLVVAVIVGGGFRTMKASKE
jgi:hypothetical protein